MKKWLFLCVFFIFLAGCQNNNGALNLNNNNNNNNQDNPYMHVKNSTADQVDQKNSEKVSQRLADLAASVPEVENASAVALGNIAIVAIDVNENLDRSKVGSIKYSVAEVLKDDPHGANALVVADPDIMARLNEIGEDIQNGQPVQGVLNELSDIVGRIIPEIPGDLQEPTPKGQMDEQKQDINNKDSKELEKEQDDQSNHQKDR